MDNSEIILQINEKHNKRKDIAIIYEKYFGNTPPLDEKFWMPINEAIIKRWSISGLNYIKEFAWKIHDPSFKTR